MSEKYTSFRQIIEAWPTLAEFGTDNGIKENTAKLMRFRDSIGPIHWPKIVASAKKRGIKGVTLELLATLYGEKKASADRERVAA